VVVCTDGAAGHHVRSRRETARIRIKEQQAAAQLGRIGVECLRLPNGRVPREGCLTADRELLAALWKTVRAFEPDYVFCPPLPPDGRAGVHVDHLVIAEAIRRVAYLINVPHAFTPEFPTRERMAKSCKTPVILTVYDGYMCGANAYDLVVDTEAAFDLVARMTWCHQSQIMEWLPWVGRHAMQPPGSFAEWRRMLRSRFDRRQRELALPVGCFAEVFTVTAWGEVPPLEELIRDFPAMARGRGRLSGLGKRLKRWRGE
jgi:LmbE family N-acetylglucosaminyl deacetylase